MTNHYEELRRKIEKHSAHVGVVGLGYVGLPLVVEFAHAGFCVTGIDVQQSGRLARRRDPHGAGATVKQVGHGKQRERRCGHVFIAHGCAALSEFVS